MNSIKLELILPPKNREEKLFFSVVSFVLFVFMAQSPVRTKILKKKLDSLLCLCPRTSSHFFHFIWAFWKPCCIL